MAEMCPTFPRAVAWGGEGDGNVYSALSLDCNTASLVDSPLRGSTIHEPIGAMAALANGNVKRGVTDAPPLPQPGGAT